MKTTVVVSVAGVPFSVNPTVAVPAVIADVSAAVLVPSPLSATTSRVPRSVVIVTVSPPTPTRLPFTSSTATVTVVVLVPSAVAYSTSSIVRPDPRLRTCSLCTRGGGTTLW